MDSDIRDSGGNTSKQGQTRTMGRVVNKVSATPVSGVIGHNPNPGLGDPEAQTKTPRKFAESGITPIMANKVRKAEGVVQLQNMVMNPGSGIERKKNQVRKM